MPVFCWGAGLNGKSVFLEVILAMMGDYGASARIETFMPRRPGDIPNDLARLAGARFVTVSETSEGQRLQESLIKDVTGGDTICARFLHREFFDFKPQFKLWIRGNHKPQIRGTI
jgi:putative DNA primase/helicase